MKQPTIITKVVMLVIFLAGVVYLVGAAWQIFTDPFSTIMTYEYTVDDAAEATGWLVRTEQVIPGQGSIVDVLPDQGEKVGAGQTVAVVYRDETALDRSRQRRALELKLQQLNYTLLRGEASWDNQRLDQSITDAMTESLSTVTTAQITYAARNSDFDGFDIQQGDYLALAESALFGTDKDLTALLKRLAGAEPQQEAEFITIFYGEDVSETQAQTALEIFTAACPNAEITLLAGGQPVYYYMISAE